MFKPFELNSNNFNIKNFKDGDIPLADKPAKNNFNKEIVYLMARFANEYILKNHKNTLAVFSSTEVLRPIGDNIHKYSYIVYSRNTSLPLDIKKDIEVAAFKFYLSLADSNAFSQGDLFNDDPRGELIKKINIDFEEARDMASEFLKKNGGKYLDKDTFVLSENFNKPLALGSTIKSLTIQNLTQDKNVYKAIAQFEVINFKKNTINIHLYNELEDKLCSKGKILYFDERLKKQLIDSISLSGFLNIEYMKETINKNYSEKLVALKFSVSEGPGGLLV